MDFRVVFLSLGAPFEPSGDEPFVGHGGKFLRLDADAFSHLLFVHVPGGGPQSVHSVKGTQEVSDKHAAAVSFTLILVCYIKGIDSPFHTAKDPAHVPPVGATGGVFRLLHGHAEEGWTDAVPAIDSHQGDLRRFVFIVGFPNVFSTPHNPGYGTVLRKGIRVPMVIPLFFPVAVLRGLGKKGRIPGPRTPGSCRFSAEGFERGL